jgi:PKD repeat protein
MKHHRFRPLSFPLGAAVALTLLAGCSGNNPAANQAPHAVLAPDNHVRWAQQEFEFDARGSSDPDGSVTNWHFEFGDGQTKDVTRQDDARIRHAYSHGGEFTVTLTVTDNGHQQEGKLTGTATARVAVNERIALSGQAVNTTLSQVKYSGPFMAYGGVDRYEVTANLTSALPAGSTDIQIRVLDATGAVVGDKTVTVPAGQTIKADVNGALSQAGTSHVEFTAKTGGANVAGEVRVYYDTGY